MKKLFSKTGHILETGIDRSSRLGATVAAAVVMAMMVFIVADVIGRQFFASPIHGTYEITRQMLVYIILLSFAYAQSQGSHIRVGTIIRYFPAKPRAMINLFTQLLALFICGLIIWGAADMAWVSWRAKEFYRAVIDVPVYPGKFIVVLGMVLFCLIVLVQIINQARGRRSAGGERQW